MKLNLTALFLGLFLFNSCATDLLDPVRFRAEAQLKKYNLRCSAERETDINVTSPFLILTDGFIVRQNQNQLEIYDRITKETRPLHTVPGIEYGKHSTRMFVGDDLIILGGETLTHKNTVAIGFYTLYSVDGVFGNEDDRAQIIGIQELQPGQHPPGPLGVTPTHVAWRPPFNANPQQASILKSIPIDLLKIPRILTAADETIYQIDPTLFGFLSSENVLFGTLFSPTPSFLWNQNEETWSNHEGSDKKLISGPAAFDRLKRYYSVGGEGTLGVSLKTDQDRVGIMRDLRNKRVYEEVVPRRYDPRNNGMSMYQTQFQISNNALKMRSGEKSDLYLFINQYEPSDSAPEESRPGYIGAVSPKLGGSESQRIDLLSLVDAETRGLPGALWIKDVAVSENSFFFKVENPNTASVRSFVGGCGADLKE